MSQGQAAHRQHRRNQELIEGSPLTLAELRLALATPTGEWPSNEVVRRIIMAALNELARQKPERVRK